MLHIKIIAVGKMKAPHFKDSAGEYIKRLAPYAKVGILEVPAEPFEKGTEEKAKEKEGERILKAVSGKESVFLLSEKGVQYSSEEFAKLLGGEKGEIVFVIGGAQGFSEKVSSAGFKKISLSKMTFPHELARVVLLEQIYRASAILTGKTYHY